MLLSFDQIINNAAKMHLYGGNLQSNITIRAIVGKGWGQDLPLSKLSIYVRKCTWIKGLFSI